MRSKHVLLWVPYEHNSELGRGESIDDPFHNRIEKLGKISVSYERFGHFRERIQLPPYIFIAL
jgi:hypothetical protein